MRCVLITALGCPVEPEVKRNLTMVSGPTRACAASANPIAPRAPAKSSSTSTPSKVFSAGANCDPFAYTSPGVSSSRMKRSLAKSVDSSEYAGDTGA